MNGAIQGARARRGSPVRRKGAADACSRRPMEATSHDARAPSAHTVECQHTLPSHARGAAQPTFWRSTLPSSERPILETLNAECSGDLDVCGWTIWLCARAALSRAVRTDARPIDGPTESEAEATTHLGTCAENSKPAENLNRTRPGSDFRSFRNLWFCISEQIRLS